MKKLAIGAIIVVLLVLTTTVALADQPPVVDAAVRIEQGFSQVTYGGSSYIGPCRNYFSNGATGRYTLKCKLELVSGDPQFWYYEFSHPGGVYTLTYSLEGNKGMTTVQYSGAWHWW
jgi:hypothetical protein